MIAQTRPDIARVAEGTVQNLKELEVKLEILTHDLAWLCQSIGHPEAAKVALLPARAHVAAPFVHAPGPFAFGTPFAYGGFLPQAYGSPYPTFPVPGYPASGFPVVNGAGPTFPTVGAPYAANFQFPFAGWSR